MDFSQITTRLYTGAGINSQADVAELAAAGITHVVDCRAEFDDTALLASNPQIAVLWNGVGDDGQPKPAEWFAKTLTFALPALAQPHMKVYTHCAAGHNRGPSACYAIMRAVGFTPDDALNLLHTNRPATVGGVIYAADADRALPELGYA